MKITPNLIKLVVLLSSLVLMIAVILHPATESIQDAVTHTFAVVVGILMHDLVGGQRSASNS